MKTLDAEIYRAYLEVKADPKRQVKELLLRFHMSRQTLYEAIVRVRDGNRARIKRCTAASRLECLWEYKYKAQYQSLPKNRKESTVRQLRQIIKDMKRDKFPQSRIAKLLRKDRSTIVHHLA